MNAILTEPFESHTYKHQSNSAGFFKIIPHPTYETAHTGIEWVCIGPGSILWVFICFVYYILFSWFCHAAVCSVSLQKFVSSLGEERFWDLVTAPQRVLCRLISLRTVTWQVWLGCCIFSFIFFFLGCRWKDFSLHFTLVCISYSRILSGCLLRLFFFPHGKRTSIASEQL